jgi:hypothetical protein
MKKPITMNAANRVRMTAPKKMTVRIFETREKEQIGAKHSCDCPTGARHGYCRLLGVDAKGDLGCLPSQTTNDINYINERIAKVSPPGVESAAKDPEHGG